MKLEKTLESFGLSQSEAQVYLAALQENSGSAEAIARRAGLLRTTTHEILGRLVSQGLATYVTKGRSRIYTAERPTKLRTLLKDKERALDAAMPELEALAKVKGIRPRVRFYEGLAGVKAVFEDTLTVSDKQLRGILSMEDLYQTPGKEFMDSYVQRRVAAGIKLRVIRSEAKEVEETWPSSTEENRELRYAPSGLVFPLTMYLYDGKVGIIGTQKENFGMIIESDDFFQTQRNLFETTWEVGRIGRRVG